MIQTAGIGTGTTISVCLVAIVLCSAVSAFVMYVFMKRRTPPMDIKRIGSPCFDSYPNQNQYSSLPTKDERPIKVKRQSSFNAGGATAGGKLLTNGTLTKSNNVTGHQTPKVLSKTNFVETDTATIKRNSHGLNNVRPPLRSVEDDKF